MNGAHLHLMFNHIPVLGGILTILLVLRIGLRKESSLLKLALPWMVLIGLLTLPVYFSGEPAEEIVEKVVGETANPYLERHEDFAIYGFLTTEVMAVLAVWGWLQLKRKQMINTILWRTIAGVSVINAVLMLLIANLGGQIRHTEIRSGFRLEDQIQ